MSTTVELNKPVMVTKATAVDQLTSFAKNGFNPIANGLGLPNGEYKFTTTAENYMGIMPVESRKSGKKLSLTFVLGQVEGRGDREGISKTFEEGTICVINADAWKQVEPATEYIMTVADNYVTTFELLDGDANSSEAPKSAPTKAEIAKAKKHLKDVEGYTAQDLKALTDEEVIEAYQDSIA